MTANVKKDTMYSQDTLDMIEKDIDAQAVADQFVRVPPTGQMMRAAALWAVRRSWRELYGEMGDVWDDNDPGIRRIVDRVCDTMYIQFHRPNWRRDGF